MLLLVFDLVLAFDCPITYLPRYCIVTVIVIIPIDPGPIVIYCCAELLEGIFCWWLLMIHSDSRGNCCYSGVVVVVNFVVVILTVCCCWLFYDCCCYFVDPRRYSFLVDIAGIVTVVTYIVLLLLIQFHLTFCCWCWCNLMLFPIYSIYYGVTFDLLWYSVVIGGWLIPFIVVDWYSVIHSFTDYIYPRSGLRLPHILLIAVCCPHDLPDCVLTFPTTPVGSTGPRLPHTYTPPAPPRTSCCDLTLPCCCIVIRCCYGTTFVRSISRLFGGVVLVLITTDSHVTFPICTVVPVCRMISRVYTLPNSLRLHTTLIYLTLCTLTYSPFVDLVVMLLLTWWPMPRSVVDELTLLLFDCCCYCRRYDCCWPVVFGDLVWYIDD